MSHLETKEVKESKEVKRETPDLGLGLDDDANIDSLDSPSNKRAKTLGSIDPDDDVVKVAEKFVHRSDLLTLRTSDGVPFTLTVREWSLSKLVRSMLEDTSLLDENGFLKPGTELPFPEKSDMLFLIVPYFKLMGGKAGRIPDKPLRSMIMSEVTDEKEANFIDGVTSDSLSLLYDTILIANYMDVNCLLHIGAAKVGSIIKGQPLERIEELLKIDSKSQRRRLDKKFVDFIVKKLGMNVADLVSLETYNKLPDVGAQLPIPVTAPVPGATPAPASSSSSSSTSV